MQALYEGCGSTKCYSIGCEYLVVDPTKSRILGARCDSIYRLSSNHCISVRHLSKIIIIIFFKLKYIEISVTLSIILFFIKQRYSVIVT